MKRIALIALFTALVFASVAGAAPVQASNLISVGMESHGGDTHSYVYGEFELAPSWVLSLNYGFNEEYAVGVWQGHVQGFYGEYTSTPEADTQLIELGVWRSMSVSPSTSLTAWAAGQSKSGESDIWAQVGAELSFEIARSVALFAGGEATVLKSNGDSQLWLGLGYYF